MNTNEQSHTQAFAAYLSGLGVTLEASAPSPGVYPADGKDGRQWPYIAYTVTVYRNGRRVWSGPYKLGVGLVKYPKPPTYPQTFPRGEWREEAESVALDLSRNRYAFIYPETHARAAAYFARQQKVSPALPDVFGSILMDGSAYFDGERFEEWADNLGLSSDSIKAKAIYDTCDAIGRDLARAFSREELETLRNIQIHYAKISPHTGIR